MKKVVIVDYELSNMFSVQNACHHVGMDAVLSSSPEEVASGDALILPGVGSFQKAMSNLESLNLVEQIKEFVLAGKPFLGVCLGLQLLFSESDEFGSHPGLDIIKGKILKFPHSGPNRERHKVPQIGWNRILLPKPSEIDQSPLKGVQNGEFMYFVHSYYCLPEDKDVVLTETNYGSIDHCSGILKNNIFAVQFHPEKSGEMGLKIYRNWAIQNQLI